MNAQTRFYDALNSIDFSERYWEFADRYSDGDAIAYYLLKGLGAASAAKKYCRRRREAFKYDWRSRALSFPERVHGGIFLKPVFAFRPSGSLFLGLHAQEETNDHLGGEFAVLAYKAKQHQVPTFEREKFGSGPPPYPRPEPRNNSDVPPIVGQYLAFVDEIGAALGP